MKKVLVFIAACCGLIGAFFAYFFWVILPIPELQIKATNSLEKNAQIVDVWFSDMEKANKFNGSVLWISNNRVMLNKGYGVTNAEATHRLDANSAMRLGSISKQFTAAGILVLAQHNKIKLDDKVKLYLPHFPYAEVSVRHLLNQVSGVPDMYMELAYEHQVEYEVLTIKLAVELLCKANVPLEFTPQSEFQYSNTNYVLLARIIEVISGQSFEEFMQENVFEPLKMNDTRVWNLVSEDDTFENKTETFSNNNGVRSAIAPDFLDGVAGDGAVFCSSSDFIKWNEFWNGNSLISDSLLAQAFVAPTLTSGEVSDYGFGWVLTDEGMWHNGSWIGAHTMFARNTKLNNCLVVLDNSDNPRIEEILDQTRPLVNGFE